jgi:nucleotide-binding universal stress UspA family protein
MWVVRELLVPVDFSDASARALETAIGLARKFRARLHLLHCYPVYPLPHTDGVPLPEGLDRDLRRAAQQRLSEWGEKANAAGVSVVEHLSPDPPVDAIVELAEEIGADWIVMGTRGLTGLRHVLLGSVAERAIQHAPCPVLSVKDI